MKYLRPYILFIFLIGLASCLKDKTVPPGDCNTIISYTDDIVPIINNSCVTGTGPGTGCHDAWIHDYDNIVGYMNNGKWHFEVVEAKTMPEIPNDFGIDSLTSDEIKMMRCWIEQGYPEN